MTTNTLISTISHLCDQRGITINKMLQDVGLNKSLVDNLKKGSIPSVDKVEKIADFFNVSIDYLLGKQEKTVSPINFDSKLNPTELRVILAYRSHPEMQPAINKLLGIDDENGSVRIYTAAHSEDNHPDEIVDMPEDKWNKIKNAPETDDTLL